MRDADVNDATLMERYGLRDNRDWKLAEARKMLRNDDHWEDKLIRVAYRPFDTRWSYFSEAAIDYPRRELIENVAGKTNICLGIGRAGMAVNEAIWSLQTISRVPMDANIYRRGGVNIFPLWLYPRQSTDLLDANPREKTANLAPDFLDALTQAGGRTPSPEDALAYIYAILYAPAYRARYADFLKRDFPRVPLPANHTLFDALVKAGHELIALHTMQTTLARITRYDVTGSNDVARVRWTPAANGLSGRVHINAEQYFDGVPQCVWDTHIGGYRVAEKWLKDRKGRRLSYDDLTHYQNVIAALSRTLDLQTEIDSAIESAGGWLLADAPDLVDHRILTIDVTNDLR